jgi:hypothetical protein
VPESLLAPWRRTGPDVFDGDVDTLDDVRSFVTISRTHPSDVGERHVYARLDGQPRTLSFGECVTDEVPPGSHHLRLHNTLVWKNIRFTVEPGEHVEFIVANVGRWWTWGVAGVLGAAPLFLEVEKRSVR